VNVSEFIETSVGKVWYFYWIEVVECGSSSGGGGGGGKVEVGAKCSVAAGRKVMASGVIIRALLLPTSIVSAILLWT